MYVTDLVSVSKREILRICRERREESCWTESTFVCVHVCTCVCVYLGFSINCRTLHVDRFYYVVRKIYG